MRAKFDFVRFLSESFLNSCCGRFYGFRRYRRRKIYSWTPCGPALESLERRLCLSSAAPVTVTSNAATITTPTPTTSVQIGGEGSVYVRYGSTANTAPLHGLGGVALEGGGSDVDQAFQWMIKQMNGRGNFLVLRAENASDNIRAGDSTDYYNPYIYDLGGVNSVGTLVIPNRAAANDPAVKKIIESADAIFISGGNQSQYLNYWKGTPVQQAIADDLARGAPIGGTSAGSDVIGQFIYSSQYDSIRSSQAMADPHDPNLTFDQNFISSGLLPFLNNTLVDTHFENRDRLGRLITFLGDVDTIGWSANHKPMGIGINQETALLIAANGQAQVVGNSSASTAPAVFFLETSSLPQVDMPGQPLTYSPIQIDQVAAGGTFNLSNWGASFPINNTFTSHSTVAVTKGSLITLIAPAAPAIGTPNIPNLVQLTVSIPTGGSPLAVPFVLNAGTSFAPTSLADSYNSVPGTVVSLRDAVAAANTSSASSTVTINLNSGEYLLSLPQSGAEDGTDGNLVVSNTIHTLVIKGQGTTGPNATIIDARLLNDRILQMMPGTTVVMQNLILTGGYATDDGTGNSSIARGGAILDRGASLTLNNVWIVGNKAAGNRDSSAQGGGIYSSGGTLAVYNSLIATNEAVGGTGNSSSPAGETGGSGQGGGLYLAGGAVTLGSASSPDKIESNLAQGGTGGYGTSAGGSGGVAQGGGIYATGGASLLTLNSTGDRFVANRAIGGSGQTGPTYGGSGGSAQGAGMYLGGAAPVLSAGKFVAPTIQWNSTYDTFQSNLASGGGGTGGGAGGSAQGAGFYSARGSLTLKSDSFTNNVALGGQGPSGGAADGAASFAAQGMANISATLFQGNVALGGAATSNGGTGGTALGGGLFAGAGSLTLQANVFLSNSARGGSGDDQTGGSDSGGTGGQAAGGGLYANNDLLTLKSQSDIFTLNSAIGGRGGDAFATILIGTSRTASVASVGANGGAGGSGLGGGALFNAGSLTIISDVVNGNSAVGGNGGQGGSDATGGAGGLGAGGGFVVGRDFSSYPFAMQRTSIFGNTARGGFGGGVFSGGVGGTGGAAQGGGLLESQGQILLGTDSIVGNSATGGQGGTAATKGAVGAAQGNNVYFMAGKIIAAPFKNPLDEILGG